MMLAKQPEVDEQTGEAFDGHYRLWWGPTMLVTPSMSMFLKANAALCSGGAYGVEAALFNEIGFTLHGWRWADAGKTATTFWVVA